MIEASTPVTRTDLATRRQSTHAAGDMRRLVRPEAVASRVLIELATNGVASTGATLWRISR